MASAGMGHRYEVPGEGLRGVIYDVLGALSFPTPTSIVPLARTDHGSPSSRART